MARAITAKVTCSIFRRLHSPYDPAQERADAEHVLLMQMEEWTQGDDPQQDEAFYYGSAAHFDPQP
jgi:hypothetical protein